MADVADGNDEWRVSRVAACRLAAAAWVWPFATARARDIDAHWARRKAEMPGFFNGRVLMMVAASMQLDAGGACFSGTLVEAGFKEFLYWRESGYPDRTVRDAFGLALVRSREGYVLLGRQRSGNINAGLAYPPGGFIDRRDIAGDGSVDIAASIAREVAEETGLDPSALVPREGFWLTLGGAQVSMAKEMVSPLGAETLRGRMLAGLSADPEAELADIVIVKSRADLDDGIPDFARALLSAVLDEQPS